MRNILILTQLVGFGPGPIRAGEIIAADALSVADIKILAELKAIEPTDFAVTVVIEDGAWSHIDALLPPEFLDQGSDAGIIDPHVIQPPAADPPIPTPPSTDLPADPPVEEASAAGATPASPPAASAAKPKRTKA